MTIALPPWLGFVVLGLVSLGAFLRGELEERMTAAALVASVVITVILRDRSWPHVQTAGFVIDVLVLLLLVGIALRTRKYWPMAAAGFQLLAVLTHVAKMIDAGLQQWAYITAIVIWTYLLIAALGVGVWNAWRRRPYGVRTDALPAAAATRR